MRALCGAIITAGAVIALGLTAMAIGARYHTGLDSVDATGQLRQLHLHDIDRPLLYILVFLGCVAVIGLALSFLGLAYHHHRRHHEFQRDQAALNHPTKARNH
jgi:hypothetical protein